MLRTFECSLNVDIQQRTCEFLEIMTKDWEAARSGLLDRMPIAENITDAKRPVGNVSMRSASPPVEIRGEEAPVCVATSPPVHNLIDLLGDPAVPSEIQQDVPTIQQDLPTIQQDLPKIQQDLPKIQQDLPDLLDDGANNQAPCATTIAEVSSSLDPNVNLLNTFESTSPPLVDNTHVLPKAQEILAFDKDGLHIHFLCQPESEKGSAALTVRFSNLKDVPLTDFTFEAAVPKYVRLTMKPASSNRIPPKGSGAETVTQGMSVVNLNHGQKPLLMKLRVSYAVNGTTVQETGQVGNFPFNL